MYLVTDLCAAVSEALFVCLSHFCWALVESAFKTCFTKVQKWVFAHKVKRCYDWLCRNGKIKYNMSEYKSWKKHDFELVKVMFPLKKMSNHDIRHLILWSTSCTHLLFQSKGKVLFKWLFKENLQVNPITLLRFIYMYR